MKSRTAWAMGWMVLAVAGSAFCQAQSVENALIAIVALKTPEKGHEAEAPRVEGALNVVGGRVMIGASGSVSSGSRTTEVQLPHRGTLRVCAATTVRLATDHSVDVKAGETPGLMMALDHGALETSLATGRYPSMVMTPDFRIQISGPGAAEVKIRLGSQGDTCVENNGSQDPFVVVRSVFEDGIYQVRSGQRVMFQHGSLREVVDTEKEPCGCPPAENGGNEFPLAQSEGLAPLATPAMADPNSPAGKGEISESLSREGVDHAAKPAAPAGNAQAQSVPPEKKNSGGIFHKLGRFLRRIFGADE